MKSSRFLISLFLFPLIFFTNQSLAINNIANHSKFNQPELTYLSKSNYLAQYPSENFPVIEVDSVYELGRLTALSFIDWVSKNPNGVIALPTGKTPELFIKFLHYYKSNWNDPNVRKELNDYGIAFEEFPKTQELKFVQLDEFYPVNTDFENSFIYYVKKYYLNLLEIKPENALLIDIADKGILGKLGVDKVFPQGKVDLSLLDRKPTSLLEKRQKQALNEALSFCKNYEDKIKSWGGIQFFLGGIGYDGHVAFNQPGSPKNSKTRLVQLNYPSSAQSAVDLGGMQYSRNKTALTIGLNTISQNEDAKIILIASGEVKAPIIQKTLESAQSIDYPISLLKNHQNLKFYLTRGASSTLEKRKAKRISELKGKFLTHPEVRDIVIQIGLQAKKPLDRLTSQDFKKTELGRALLEHSGFDLKNLTHSIKQELVDKINQSQQVGFKQTLLHTAPHHDDVMLSYYGYMPELLKYSQNYFSYITSGFNSVTDQYIVDNLKWIKSQNKDKLGKIVLKTSYQNTLNEFSRMAYPKERQSLDELDARILAQKLVEIYDIKNPSEIIQKAKYLVEDYFQNKRPGQLDISPIKILKGAMRESEVDRLWDANKIPQERIFHMRSKFYTGEAFKPLPTIEEDAKPVLDLLHKINPDIVTVAYDPEGTGPDTHYKVLQVVAEALKLWKPEKQVKVWGYRNVWHRFSYSDANRFIPVSKEQLLKIDNDFTKCFYTQKNAAFPSPFFDGKFSELSIQIQQQQAKDLRVLLGNEFFDLHPNEQIRNAKGFLLFKEMSESEFSNAALSLKSRIELDKAFEQ